MKFTTREDIEVPANHVFAVLSDFEMFERQALRRGAEIKRVDNLAVKGVGMTWDLAFTLRSKVRELTVEMTEYDMPNRMVFESRSPSLGGHMVVDLVALSPNRTRLSIQIELKPQNLSARLLVQSLKLAKNNINKRFEKRIAIFARDTEEGYQKRMA